MRHIFILLGFLIFVSNASEAKQADELVSVESGYVIHTKNNGAVALADIYVPQLSDDNAKSWIEQRKDDKVALEIQENLAYKDRYKRQLAYVYDGKGRSFQLQLVKEGMAMVWPHDDVEASSASRQLQGLYKAELHARDTKKGIWSHKDFTIYDAIRDKKPLGERKHQLVLVEGKIHAVHDSKTGFFVNFEELWQEDVTIGVEKDAAKILQAQLFPGDFIRVRGWLSSYNGPFVNVYQPGQIEILQD